MEDQVCLHSGIFKQSCDLSSHHFSCWEILTKQQSGLVQLQEEVNTSPDCRSSVPVKATYYFKPSEKH